MATKEITKPYKTYLFLYIPEQTITGVNALDTIEAELLQIAEMEDRFYGLAYELAQEFNYREKKQTAHIARKLIVTSSSNPTYAREIAETKI